MFYVYILLCTDHHGKKSLYTGQTENLDRRYHDHWIGKGASYTRGKQLQMVFVEIFTTRAAAMQRESIYKTWSTLRKKKLVHMEQVETTREKELSVANQLARVKRAVKSLEEFVKQKRSDMDVQKSFLIDFAMQTLELPENELPSLRYPVSFGTTIPFAEPYTLELRAVDSKVKGSVVYDAETERRVRELQITVEACEQEIMGLKMLGKVVEEEKYVRTWQVWLHEPKPEKVKKSKKAA